MSHGEVPHFTEFPSAFRASAAFPGLSHICVYAFSCCYFCCELTHNLFGKMLRLFFPFALLLLGPSENKVFRLLASYLHGLRSVAIFRTACTAVCLIKPDCICSLPHAAPRHQQQQQQQKQQQLHCACLSTLQLRNTNSSSGLDCVDPAWHIHIQSKSKSLS